MVLKVLSLLELFFKDCLRQNWFLKTVICQNLSNCRSSEWYLRGLTFVKCFLKGLSLSEFFLKRTVVCQNVFQRTVVCPNWFLKTLD